MKGLVSEADPTDHGGFVKTATSTIIENGKRAALVGDLVDCPRDGHGVNPIVEGDPSMMSDGKSLVTHLSRAACGCRVLARHTTLLAG
ncbi:MULTISPECIES: PAAR domain-containing protein [unclassified Caballeronia]|uniref:PAAR domain-containing protein n=1 Tax=unclassified Caballeronia TaxID=2646786 RepID=UPI00202882B0|nr:MULTISPECIES: PAAR domain-containing protein [unclassified Caballeronia]MDR5769105.1 PAAR domain-containing protein [Caballeronia sp. LZ028]